MASRAGRGVGFHRRDGSDAEAACGLDARAAQATDVRLIDE